jgi:hypothetical protein
MLILLVLIGDFLQGEKMNKKKIRLLLALLLSALALSGCGTPLYELTAEEEDLIVQYAAYYLAKNNIYQKDGLVNVSEALLEEEQETEIETVWEEPEENASGSESSITPASGTTLGDTVTLAQAIGSPLGISVTCVSCYQTDSYMAGTHYLITPSSGDSFVVMKFAIENLADEAVDLDIAGYVSGFRMSYDGITWVDNYSGIMPLMDDLTAYQGTIGAGETQQLVLLFETSMPKNGGESVPQLCVVNGGVTHPIIY